MNTSTEMKSMTVRLQPQLYNAAIRVASESGKSMNALIQAGLESVVREAQDREMYEAATLLSMDEEECSVEYAIYAQSEVVLRDEQ